MDNLILTGRLKLDELVCSLAQKKLVLHYGRTRELCIFVSSLYGDVKYAAFNPQLFILACMTSWMRERSIH